MTSKLHKVHHSVSYTGILLFDNRNFFNEILSLESEDSESFSKSNCFLNNLYIVHIEDVETSVYQL